MSKTILDELINPEVEELSESQLGALGEACNRLIAKQKEIEAAEEALKQLKAEERKINQGEIPTMMEALGFETITLQTGQKVSVKDSVQCAIPATVRPRAYKWMEDQGHGDLIKIALSAKFPRGAKDSANEAYDALTDLGIAPTMAESIHPGTLKAWAREEISEGRSLPSDLFKVHVVKLTTIK